MTYRKKPLIKVIRSSKYVHLYFYYSNLILIYSTHFYSLKANINFINLAF